MAWKDKEGKDIDVSGVDTKIVDVVGRIVEGAVVAATAGMKQTVTDAVGAAVKSAVEPIAKRVEAVEKAKPAEKPAEEPKTGTAAEIAKAIEAAMKPVLDTVTGLKTERESERAQATSRQLAEAYVTKHFPNLKGKDRVIARIAAAGVKTEEEAKAKFDDWKAEQAAYGIDVEKQLSADPGKEGAKDQAKGGDAESDAAKRAKIEAIKKRGAA